MPTLAVLINRIIKQLVRCKRWARVRVKMAEWDSEFGTTLGRKKRRRESKRKKWMHYVTNNEPIMKAHAGVSVYVFICLCIYVYLCL